MQNRGAPNRNFSTQITPIEIWLVVLFVTLMTSTSLDRNLPRVGTTVRVLGYLSVLIISFRIILHAWRNQYLTLSGILNSYSQSFMVGIAIYMIGYTIGALRSPDFSSSIWHVLSTSIVFLFAFVSFGWLQPNLDESLKNLFKILAVVGVIVLVLAVLMHIDMKLGWTQLGDIFKYSKWPSGIFGRPATLGYIVMIGFFSAATLASLHDDGYDLRWVAVAGLLFLGVFVPFVRSIIIATVFGGIGILSLRKRRLAISLLLIVVTVGVPLGIISFFFPETPLAGIVPRVGLSNREEVYPALIQNLKSYGIWGTGAHQVESIPGKGAHNAMLQIYGEGGFLAVLGILAWLIIPVIHIKRSNLRPILRWSLVIMMASNQVHLLFHGGFIGGLRLPTLFFVSIWISLATQRITDPNVSTSDLQTQ